ncbi:hypothetical protein L1279_001170 [Planomicrobium sp. HSC-17F08]|nr:hypothetical protein [Planomicrobium sp. HSC-17F08]
MGYINYAGIIIFSFIVMLALIFYHDAFPDRYLSAYCFIFIYIIATANINRCVLPYKKQQPGLVFISKKLLVKHLYFTVKKGYLLQIVLASLISLTFILVEDQYFIIAIAGSAVVVSFLSMTMSGMFSFIVKIISLLQIFFIITSSFGLVAILLVLQLLLIYFYISNFNRLPLTAGLAVLKSSDKKYVPRNILRLFFIYVNNNKILMILLGVSVAALTYFAQSILTRLEGLPALILIYINFMTILEVLIGSKREEIMVDKARIETMQASLIVSPFKRFKSSSIYLISLLLGFVSLCGIVGVIVNTSNMSIILKNFLSIPIILFIGVVYFRKTELLITGYEHKLLKLSLPILLLICITIFTITI